MSHIQSHMHMSSILKQLVKTKLYTSLFIRNTESNSNELVQKRQPLHGVWQLLYTSSILTGFRISFPVSSKLSKSDTKDYSTPQKRRYSEILIHAVEYWYSTNTCTKLYSPIGPNGSKVRNKFIQCTIAYIKFKHKKPDRTVNFTFRHTDKLIRSNRSIEIFSLI